jgi:hypothetical protein
VAQPSPRPPTSPSGTRRPTTSQRPSRMSPARPTPKGLAHACRAHARMGTFPAPPSRVGLARQPHAHVPLYCHLSSLGHQLPSLSLTLSSSSSSARCPHRLVVYVHDHRGEASSSPSRSPSFPFVSRTSPACSRPGALAWPALRRGPPHSPPGPAMARWPGRRSSAAQPTRLARPCRVGSRLRPGGPSWRGARPAWHGSRQRLGEAWLAASVPGTTWPVRRVSLTRVRDHPGFIARASALRALLLFLAQSRLR